MYIFWNSTRRARTEHFCDFCCTQITPGGTYTRYAWVPQPGRFFILKHHSWPSCPPDPYAEAELERSFEMSVSYKLEIKMEAVTLMRVNGTPETRFEPRVVIVGTTEDDQPMDESDIDDIPF